MDYDAIGSAGGFGKPVRKKKESVQLKTKKKLKSKNHVIPEEIRKAVFEEKGGLCLMGLCEHCGGTDPATDLHHHPFRSQNGKDIPEHLWPINRLCHTYYHDHPIEEKEMFRLIETSGYRVIWKVNQKGLGVRGKG